MKNVIKVLALSMVVVLSVLMLVSCSSYGKIQSAYEKAGYTLKGEETGTIETENGVITYTIHTFQKEGEGLLGGLTQALSTAVVWEFSSSADLAAALEESETLKGIIKDLQNSDYVNGNCVLTTVNPDALEIFKGTK